MTDREYYAEGLDCIPFSMTVDMMKSVLPTPIAYAIAAYYRARRLIGLRAKPAHAFGPPGSATEVAIDQMPARAMARWAAKLEQLRDLGFQPLCYRVPDLIGAKEAATALFLDQAGSTLLTLEWQRIPAGGGETTEVTPAEFNSYPNDGKEILTGMVAEQHLPFADVVNLDFVDQHFMADSVSIGKAYQKHRQRIADRQPAHFNIHDAKNESDTRTQNRFDALVENGIMFKLNEKQVRFAKQQSLPVR